MNNCKIKRTFKESIEPEEILLDAAKESEMSESKMEVPIKPRIFRICLAIIFVLLGILTTQSFYLQFIKGKDYKILSERNYIRVYPVLAPRGIIYDRFFRQLVYNIPAYDLAVMPPDLPKNKDERLKIVSRVAEITGLSSEAIEKEIQIFDLKTGQTFLLADNLSQGQVLKLEPEIKELKGFVLQKNIVRQYVDGPDFSHLLGYLGKLNQEEIKNSPDYFLTEKIGKQGLEMVYEKSLRGQPGRREVEVDARGSVKREANNYQSQPGQSLVLTIDGDLQKKLYEILNETLGRLHLKKAAAVALDPQTGGILAMVSLPSFDNNLFSQGISPADFAVLTNNPARPLLNSAIAGQYAPGSTIKPLIGAAALEEKVIFPSTKIQDSGEIAIVNQYNPEIIYRFLDWKAHGAVDIYSAIAQSCNVYFYTIGGGYDKIKGLGIERLEKYFKLFGLGETLGVDLSLESSGLVPGAAWKEKNKGERWYIGDTYHLSIGQGDLLVTPLQLAAAMASLSNGGKLLTPYLADKIIDSDKNVIKQIEPKVIRENFISTDNLKVIKKGMRQTVLDGSARLLSVLKVPVAGKTGTAQVAGQKNSNAWFVGFAPDDDPKIVLVILIENAGEGSQVAVPAAKEVLEWYFSKQSTNYK